MPRDHELHTRVTYDAVADAYADHFTSTEPEQPIDLAMIEHFISLLPQPKAVLDAGCGAGRMMPYLAAHGCQVQGVDLSSGMVRRARLDHPGFTTHVASLTDLGLNDSSFDGAFSWYSTIHSPDEDLPVVLRELGRILRPGGLLLLGFQTGSGRHEVAQGYRDRGHDVQLFRYSRNLDQMTSVALDSGFEVACRMDRIPAVGERDGQAVLIARKAIRG